MIRHQLVQRTKMNDLGDSFELNDFYKYLKCPACREQELYCPTHRAEVEKMLDMNNSFNEM